ncbi:hypothetical protein ZIOFF_042224 [Zingiber officinale]|uniref:Uncharacterized protein n=1 Tax=Zingiber officinale TaxID=94328 RepID=A0A8J5L229_ZINOF|nr:hypothetical protein ZIOFF_042224 [Zingiber officinale]
MHPINFFLMLPLGFCFISLQIYAVSITIRIVLGFMLIALIWKFDFSPFMILIIAILNHGTILAISRDQVKPSPMPDSWKLKEIFATGIVFGGYLALITVIFFWAMKDTDFFSIATIIAVYADWSFARIKGIGWGWAGVIWLYNIIFFFPLDGFKFVIRYILSGKAWDNLFENKTTFTAKKDYGRQEREFQWARAQRTRHGLTNHLFSDKSSYGELSEITEQAKKRATMAMYGFLAPHDASL